MKKLATASLFALLVASATWAQCRSGAPARVSFQRGRTTAVINSRLAPDGEACYALRARAGQQMTVHVSSSKNGIHFSIFPPSQNRIISGETNDWSGMLPETGDYVIALYPPKRWSGDSFTLEVTVSAAVKPGDATARKPADDPAGQPPRDPEPQFRFNAGECDYLFDGRAPRGFEGLLSFGFSDIALTLTPDGASIASVAPDPHVTLSFKGGREFKSKQASVTGDQISFETKSVRGVSYQFTGRFTRGQVDGNTLLDAKLKGRLTKLFNGSKVAETQLNLYQVCGG